MQNKRLWVAQDVCQITESHELLKVQAYRLTALIIDQYSFNTWQDLAAKIDQASEAGEQFAKLYYETFDKKRHVSRKKCPVIWFINQAWRVPGLE